MSAKPFAAQADGVRLAVRVTPRASRNAVGGVAMDAEGRALMKIRLAAPPVDGAANDALIDFLAGALSLRKRDIEIRSGETGRVKILHLSGDAAAILARLEAMLRAISPPDRAGGCR